MLCGLKSQHTEAIGLHCVDFDSLLTASTFWTLLGFQLLAAQSGCALMYRMTSVKVAASLLQLQQQQQQQDSSNNKAVADIRLRPRCRHLANSTKHNVVLDFGPLAPLCENIDIRDVLHCSQRMTDPWPQINRLAYRKFGEI